MASMRTAFRAVDTLRHADCFRLRKALRSTNTASPHGVQVLHDVAIPPIRPYYARATPVRQASFAKCKMKRRVAFVLWAVGVMICGRKQAQPPRRSGSGRFGLGISPGDAMIALPGVSTPTPRTAVRSSRETCARAQVSKRHCVSSRSHCLP
ncbi:hypothetical protein PsYK624_155190 [Phanerochaete sordida]|uniref:Uncharacterized protein n=1 Tax=Phanerochaete sordida TaxID=48140 RepID=A0A9P3LL75_9APHY|nr:hypothetical protein PsYK624_155190 [Phanerochaete sordida]